MKFTKKQIERYSRQIILKKIGSIGQKKLLKSSVLIVGAGGLGSPIAIYLTALGIGKIGIIDKDKVEISNLSRQIIFFLIYAIRSMPEDPEVLYAGSLMFLSNFLTNILTI